MISLLPLTLASHSEVHHNHEPLIKVSIIVVAGFAFILIKSITMDHLAAALMDFESSADQPGPCSYVQGAEYNSFAIIIQSSDYCYDTGDPSNNFIGILDDATDGLVFKAGSIHNLCGNTIYCSYLANGGSFTAWIDLTPEQTLQVRFANGSYPKVGRSSQPLLERSNVKFPAGLGDFATLIFVGNSRENHIQAHEISLWKFFSREIPKTIPSSQRESWIR